LCLLIPSYSYLLDDFDGHYRTRRCSPTGALTLVQPVVRAKSPPRWADRAYFHCSLSPLYLRDWISRVISLCRYSQHDRSASGFCIGLAVLDGCHLAVVGLVVVEGFAGVVLVFAAAVIAMVAICGVMIGACITYFGTITAGFGVISGVFLATCRTRISSSVSISSSSESDGAAWSSTTTYAEAGGLELEPCNCINSFVHLVAPSTSSICFSLLLVLVI
jgi:hypothetical protein